MMSMVIKTFMARCVLPLKARAHAMWDYIGTEDPTIESDKFIPRDSLDRWMRVLLGSSALDFGKGPEPGPNPYCEERPWPAGSPFVGMSSNP